MDQDLCIGFALEFMPPFDQLFLKGIVVLDDAVMDDRQIAGPGYMGMSVLIRRGSVSGPSGMAYSDAPFLVAVSDVFFKVGDLSGRLISIELLIIIDKSNSRRIVSSVFETLKPFDQGGISFLRADITDYTAHRILDELQYSV